MSRARIWLLIFLGWTGLALFLATRDYVAAWQGGHPILLANALVIELSCAWIWFGLTPGILYVSQRFPLTAGRWPLSLPVHLLAALACTLVDLVIYTFLYRAFVVRTAPLATDIRNMLIGGFHDDLLKYSAAVAIEHIVRFARRDRERELQTAQLQMHLTQARLDALEMQIQPHFLFNTLNAISVLIFSDAEAANEMLLHLSVLLRSTLDRKGREVPLREEIDTLNQYLAIERVRFQDRLTVSMEIEPGALDVAVPHFILQPIVENAIQHGIARSSRAGRVNISAARENGSLLLSVRDDGPGLGDNLRMGIGLSNTEARLTQLYGSKSSIHILPLRPSGLGVEITIPVQLA
jgi:two-component system, LytTR family, sensor kinase